MPRLLLISNSTVHGRGYLDHVQGEIRDFVGNRTRLAFVPYALHDRQAYSVQAESRLRELGLELTSVHQISNPPRAIEESEIIFVGGGNTFRLLYELQKNSVIEPVRRAVRKGTVYIGSSAGSIVACPSLKTTKDMPIVQPLSFEALGLVRFQISPHYLDPDPKSTHMGETQEQRILQFLEENEEPVIGLREGSFLRVEEDTVVLKGPHSGRIFRCGTPPAEIPSGTTLNELLLNPTSSQGLVA
ncbi:MAG TPA: dipeptidase PepE [Terriglobales bacterium]|nr:dipeptidase PepE [Terriglobales bacterium]